MFAHFRSAEAQRQRGFASVSIADEPGSSQEIPSEIMGLHGPIWSERFHNTDPIQIPAGPKLLALYLIPHESVLPEELRSPVGTGVGLAVRQTTTDHTWSENGGSVAGTADQQICPMSRDFDD
jgi:hypothetical protein